MATILFINPNTSRRTTEMMLGIARPLLPIDTELRGATATTGPAMIVEETALARSAEEVVRIALAEGRDAIAIIVGAFGDPGIAALRRFLTVPVIGIGEAAMREAASGGRRFGVATTTPGLFAAIRAKVLALGLADRFTGVRGPRTALPSPGTDRASLDEALAQATGDCIMRDKADAVVIGGGPLSEAAAGLAQRYPGAIVEPVPAAMRALRAALRTVSAP